MLVIDVNQGCVIPGYEPFTVRIACEGNNNKKVKYKVS